MLFQSGEDANPLNRRLPAEIVSRRRPEVRKPEPKPVEDVKVDLKTALLLKPEARLKWLAKACKVAEEGRASTTELHNIVSSRKFVAGVHPRIGRRMAEIVHENLGIFSDKQQKHLKSDEWVLSNAFSINKGADADGDDQERECDERSRSRDRSEEDGRKGKQSEEPATQPPRRFQELASGKEGSGGGRNERSGRRVRNPEPEGWIEAPAIRRQEQEERAKREVLLAEDARKKALEQQQAKKETT